MGSEKKSITTSNGHKQVLDYYQPAVPGSAPLQPTTSWHLGHSNKRSRSAHLPAEKTSGRPKSFGVRAFRAFPHFVPTQLLGSG
jgi:hypothetical protein